MKKLLNKYEKKNEIKTIPPNKLLTEIERECYKAEWCNQTNGEFCDSNFVQVYANDIFAYDGLAIIFQHKNVSVNLLSEIVHNCRIVLHFICSCRADWL